VSHPGGAYAGAADDEVTTPRSRWLRRPRTRQPAADLDGDLVDVGDDLDGETPAPRHRADAAPRPRRFTWRAVLFTLLVLAVLGGAFATIQWYGRSAYFVGFSGNDVAIFHGRPGGLLWIDPELVERTDLRRSDVPADAVSAIRAGKEEPSLDEAQAYVDRLVEQNEEAATPPVETTTTSVAPPPLPAPAPAGATPSVPA
jgi:PPM family protein phosphatase